MSTLGCIPENHDWCLQQLLTGCYDIFNLFKDFTFNSLQKDLVKVMCEEFVRVGFECYPASRDLDFYLFICAEQFAEHQAYGTAFAVSVLANLDVSSKKFNFEETIVWRKKVAEDVEKYENELKLFEPLVKSFYNVDLKKSAFYYLEMMHDYFCFMYYPHKEKFEETHDYRLHHLRKRFELNVLPNGVIPYLFRVLANCLYFLDIGRYKQVRHLLAVVSELMKSVNQDTADFKKLNEYFLMVKTMHWAMILCKSEFKEAAAKIQGASDLATPKERVIDFGIPLPDGEDLDLPTDLIETEADRAPIYKKLWTYKRILKRSTLPHIARIYDSVLTCDINFYDANTSTPWCCGKHECLHPHKK